VSHACHCTPQHPNTQRAQVTEGLIRPVAKALNDRLGAVLKGVSSDNVANGLATVLDSAAGTLGVLMLIALAPPIATQHTT
jgi:hypothetical protein